MGTASDTAVALNSVLSTHSPGSFPQDHGHREGGTDALCRLRLLVLAVAGVSVLGGGVGAVREEGKG